MAKSKTKSQDEGKAHKSKSGSTLSTFDPTLEALFATSAGPVTAPVRPVRTYKSTLKPIAKAKGVAKNAVAEGETSSSGSDDNEVTEEVEDSSSSSGSEAEVEEPKERPRKRRKVDQDEDLEGRYLDKLMREEEHELKQKKREPVADDELRVDADDDEENDSDLNSGLEDLSDSDTEKIRKKKVAKDIAKDEDDALPKHESLSSSKHDVEASKLSRTVFLGNVSISVIKSKSAKKTLILHLRSGIDEKHHEKIESIRFRSTAFVSDAGPKRAAYAKKELMEETMKSTNAYVVGSSDAVARKLASRLNGTIVLDRHLRVDSLAQPLRVDHRRCVFVGNLSFTDEAPATDEAQESENKRKRAKEPADVEEGLWRSFGKAGKVENVRVVRDKETRISKGFAYVQFADENAVEAALLMDGKKFPPMLPRPLRVQRAKRDVKGRKTPGERSRMPERKTEAPRPKGLKSGVRSIMNGDRQVIFEGHRASSGSLPKGAKKLKKRPDVRPDNRGSKRAAAFRAGHGKKKRDMAV